MSTTRSTSGLWPLALLGVLALGVAVEAAFAANSLAAPTITASPANPTSSQTASFTYTHSQAITKFQCAMDGGSYVDCGTTRPSSKTYTGLAAGAHTFRVRAVSGSKTSSDATYSWNIDRAAPSGTITATASSATNASSVSWAAAFNENVTGVDAGDFALVPGGGIVGASITSVTPVNSASYVVTAATGTGDGTLRLNLVDNDSIRDAALNPLGGPGAGNGNFSGPAVTIDRTPPANPPTITAGPSGSVSSTSAQFGFGSSDAGVSGFRCQLDSGAVATCTSPKSYTGLAQGNHQFKVMAVDAAGNAGPPATRTWTVDTTAPPKPTFSQTPPDPSSSAIATFAFASQPATDVDRYQCSKENGSWFTCASPYTFTVDATNNGQHQFAVRAVDAAGNVSSAASYKWKVSQTEGAPFQITGSASGPLYPGVWRTIPLVLTNPNTVSIYVTNLTVTVTNSPAGCATATNIELVQSSVSASNPITVPASGTTTVPVAMQPQIRLKETGVNQDACKNVTFTLSYTGSSHS
jgi:hypothetical protein